ncbi:nucleoside-diphosphate-sugar epimerase [Glaciihabitans tibetensis]|uniref:Nucleoside-diphosphate-sugar epimerase n=1 Tax=Glaciihabitans tibetensis TaxID=1266600 RepID=A0A2T0V6Q5_9MICO|nr:NmrA family NAD(P)-binding protein [Glaciihabitans tibetensis]PRY65875.1 nucleoside-diphosphate-sugar epimerase [Glaciihabitans tibetensis]
MTSTILIAGATGDLGQRIVRELLQHDVQLRVLTRPGSGSAAALYGDDSRIDIVTAAYSDHAALTTAVSGVDVVVSAVSGVRPVIVDAQRALLKATVAAGVPRFIPSDYSADYRQITPGSNRNFEIRREFAADLDVAPVQATSILNGMFTDLLTDEAPMILFGLRRVLFWSSADQILDFTTKDDVARVTALAALDSDAPRVIEIAGAQVSARDVARTMTELTGTPFKLQWAGTTGTLSVMSKVGKQLSKNPDETFPAWQGMQYFVSMFSGQAQLRHVDNDRYGPHTWTTVRDVLQAHLTQERAATSS